MTSPSGSAASQQLPPWAFAFRVAHAVVSVSFLLAIVEVWRCALTGRRGPLLRMAVTALAGEGVLVAANHGDCPLAGMQASLGDPVPLFELVLPPRAARRAVPALAAVTGVGFALLGWRRAGTRT